MYCGLDFGTSNCSIGDFTDGQTRLIPIDGTGVLMPSSIFTMRKVIKAQPVDEREVTRLTDQFCRHNADHWNNADFAGKAVIRDEMERLARQQLQREANREALQKYSQQGISSISESSEIIVGSEAIRLHALYSDDGIYAKSPKSFLGSDISQIHLNSFSILVHKMLAHIKQRAEGYCSKDFDSVVIGRPVNYSTLASERGNTQALEIMRRAAILAGFTNVEFEFEPVAAAIDFERTLRSRSHVLVVDIGGGTTDVTMMVLSPEFTAIHDRQNHILASDGTRVGGNDIDILFALYKIARHLGKESLDKNGQFVNRDSPISLEVYWNAVQVNNVHAMAAFRASGVNIFNGLKHASGSLKTKIARLKVLHEKDYAFRFNRSSEMAKILLSSKESIHLPLRYLGDECVIELDRDDLEDAMSTVTSKIRKLIQSTISMAGVEPDYIYFTGGSAKSPTLMNLVLNTDEREKVILGDLFGSVTHGLVLAARNRFG